MANLTEYHSTLAQTMAAYQPVPLPSESESISHPHEEASAAFPAQSFPRFLSFPRRSVLRSGRAAFQVHVHWT